MFGRIVFLFALFSLSQAYCDDFYQVSLSTKATTAGTQTYTVSRKYIFIIHLYIRRVCEMDIVLFSILRTKCNFGSLREKSDLEKKMLRISFKFLWSCSFCEPPKSHFLVSIFFVPLFSSLNNLITHTYT
jgi:hypothetical protein